MTRLSRSGLLAGLCLPALLQAATASPAFAQSEYMPCTAKTEDGPWYAEGSWSNGFGHPSASAATFLTLPMSVADVGSGPDVRALVETVSLAYALDRSLTDKTQEDDLRVILRTHDAVPAWKGKSFTVRFALDGVPHAPDFTAEMPFEGYSERAQTLRIWDADVKQALTGGSTVSFRLALPGGAVLDSGEITGFAAMQARAEELMATEIERGNAQQCGQ